MTKPGKIKLHREPDSEPGIAGDQTFSVEGSRALLMPFFEKEGEVRLSEIARAVGEEYNGNLMAGCTAIESIGGMRGGRAILKGYVSEPSQAQQFAGPPTTEIPCPTCSGRGTVISYDVEAMQAKRKALRLTQSAVARAAGWQASIVSELESGSRPMTEASAERYWKALHEAERRGA